MNKTIPLACGVELQITNTEYATSHELINNPNRMLTNLGIKIK